MRESLRLPRLPREWYEPSRLGSAGFLLFAFGLYAVPAALAGAIAISDWPLAARVLAIAPLLLLAQQGLHDLGFTGHEGFHFLLHRNKWVSVFLGMFFSSSIAFFMEVGVANSHLRHHRYTNRPEDPDPHLFARFRTFPERFFKQRIHTNRTFMMNAIRLALGRSLSMRSELPFSERQVTWLARANVALVAMWLAIYVALLAVWPLAAFVGIVLPHVLAFLASGLRPYLEHAGLGEGRFVDARSYCSPWLTAAFYWNNLHLEHHLYPGVPCYRLGKVHRLLAEQGVFERAGSPVEPTLSGALECATRRFAYPRAEIVLRDEARDPAAAPLRG